MVQCMQLYANEPYVPVCYALVAVSDVTTLRINTPFISHNFAPKPKTLFALNLIQWTPSKSLKSTLI